MPDGSDDEAAPPVAQPSLIESTSSPELTRSLETTQSAEPVRRSSEPCATSRAPRRPVTATSSDAIAQLRDPDRYVILGEHGRGGLGRVSRAHDRDLGRDVAIKELIARGDIGEARFLREALITARLEHPGIVPVHEAGRWPDGTPFYAMKLVAGRPLRDVLAEKTTVDIRVALLHHVIAVADAIAYAHGRNIIHRDLKPSNVIIGDFGETVVIDWGLAKDLTTPDEPNSLSGSRSLNRDERLTSTGSVLGTPAYMPPEQLRGEPVDQRADVYAIGAMLWELCTLEKLPPNYTGQRHRILRRARIDQDLATIVQKALAPDPARRYPDAGALAADLKAFKAGARIAARRYSLWARLAHWLRHHRALTLSVVAAIVIAAIGVTRYLRDIGAQRDRADASEKIARRAQAAAETSVQELTLKHAQSLLATDPTEATSVLSTYRGADRVRADQLLAEAKGRGVALLRATPHTDSILWAQGTSKGTVLSLGADGSLSSTSSDGISTVLHRSAEPLRYLGYASERHLLAFSCEPVMLCLYDPFQLAIVARLKDIRVIAVAFSPDERLLALMTNTSFLKVLDIRNPASPVETFSRSVHYGWDVRFVDRDVVAVGTPEGAEFVRLSGNEVEHLAAPDGGQWDADSAHHELAYSNTHGEVFVMTAFPVHVTAHHKVCPDAIIGIRFIAAEQVIGYACRDGAVGRWNIRSDSVETLAQLEGHTSLLAVSSSGEYLLAAGGNGTLTVIDLHAKLNSVYRGHGFRLTSITPPTSQYPFLITADARGGIRKWPLPSAVAHMMATSGSRLHRIAFGTQSHTLVATSNSPQLTTYSETGDAQAISGHELSALMIERAPDGAVFAMHGYGDIVELWSWPSLHRMDLIQTNQGSISQVSFVPKTNELLTSGYDGRLVHWKRAGQSNAIADIGQPIDRFSVVNQGSDIVLGSIDGTLWRVEPSGQRHILRQGSSRVTQIVPLADTHLYVGYTNGDIVEIDTRSWTQNIVIRAARSVRQIVTQGEAIAIATNSDVSYFRPPPANAHTSSVHWMTLPDHVSSFTFSDDLLVAVCIDGAVWLYSMSHEKWIYLATGGMNLGWVTAADDGATAAAMDTEGHIVWLDLELAHELFRRGT